MAGVFNSDPYSYTFQSQNDVLANKTSGDKDKTPMCLINELARFNKVLFIFIYT